MKLPRDQRGFSLIELMVVVLIIGLTLSVVGIGVGDGKGGHQIRREAKQFANVTAMVAEEALLAREQWGVDLYRDSDERGELVFAYRWLRFNSDQGWQVASARELDNRYQFSAGFDLLLYVEGAEVAIGNRIAPEKRTVVVEGELAPKLRLAEVQQVDGDRSEKLLPEILLLSSGEMSPFRLQLIDRDNPELTETIEGDALGRLSLLSKVDREDDYAER